MTIDIRCIISLLALIAGIVSPSAVNAESLPEGTWKVYPTYSNPPQKVVDTENEVFYTANNRLFSFDKKEQENRAYTIQNKLNDNTITGIYYNFDRHYLLVAYSSGNIDLLYSDGRVRNMSDIRDSAIDPPVTITGVAFDGDNIYVATAFGVVRFSEQRGEVVTSGNYGSKINAIAVVGDNLVVHTNGNYYSIDKKSILSSFKDFKKMHAGESPIEIKGLSDDQMLVHLKNASNTISVQTVDFTTGTLKGSTTVAKGHSALPEYLMYSPEGDIYYVADNKLYGIGDGFREELLAVMPDDWASAKIGTSAGKESVWVLTGQGLGNYALDGEGGVTMNMDHYRPDAFSVGEVRCFYPSADGRRLYAQNYGVTAFRYGGSSRGLDKAQTAGYIDLASGEMVDVTAYPVDATVGITQNYQKTYGRYAMSPNGFAELSSDPLVYFLSTGDDGLYKIKNGGVEGRYGHLNCPVNYIDNRDIFYGCTLDRGGNLWAVRNTINYTLRPFMILPADKVKLNPDQVKLDDWITPTFDNAGNFGGMDARFLHCKRSNLMLSICSGGEQVFVYDHRGTPNNFSDDRYHLWEKFIDQDGKEFTARFKGSLLEDLNGKIWIGTNEGIIEMNPANALNPSATMTHLKVPRNDGSNLADYLLGSDFANDMAVDAANRKWIATSSSGLFLVSESGDRIIANFTMDNSPLTTNSVNCVYVDQPTGVVYIGTDNGLLAYSSDVTPPKENYDEILVYPNPVKPEYRGSVHITGLMDNSLVKIADASGSVVCQGRSEGGKFLWNCCNSAGVRVKTGIYYVMASQNASGSSSGAVAKIMVVN